MAVYHTTTTVNDKKPHSQAVGASGGGGYFFLLTLSEPCLLLQPDKLLHTSLGDRQADSCKDSYFYTPWEKWNIYIYLYTEFSSFTANLLSISIPFYSVYNSHSPLHSFEKGSFYESKCSFPPNFHLLLVFSTEFCFNLSLPTTLASSVLLFCSLFSLVNTIAQAVSCCRHFVADHGAESPLPSNCQSVHFMLHIPSSPFVRLPLASHLFF